MRIAILTTDNREQWGRYDLPVPIFGPALSALLEGFAMLGDEIEVHVISCSKKRMAAPAKISGNIWFHQPIVPRLGWGRSLFLGCAFAVRRLLREIQPDIVHGQGTERDCSVSAVLSAYTNVITIHGNMRAVGRSLNARAFSYYWLAGKLEEFALLRTDGVFCNSSYTKSEVGDLCTRKWDVPNCLLNQFFSPFPPEETRKKNIVVLGIITTYKRSLEILKMWIGIANRFPDVKLVFIGKSGSGPYGQEFNRLINDPSVRNCAAHYDWIEGQKLVDTLDSARGMIHFPAEEAFGLAVAEGVSRNLKVFAAATGGIPDVVKDCECVELLDPNDWALLAEKISAWIAKGMPLGASSEVMYNRFSPLVIARIHADIYRKLYLKKSHLSNEIKLWKDN